jgi:uncharacterized protein YjbJ (UPF0337 family)
MRCRIKGQEKKMDWNRIEGSWKELKGKIKQQWGNLTDDDLDRIAGKREARGQTPTALRSDQGRGTPANRRLDDETALSELRCY